MQTAEGSQNRLWYGGSPSQAHQRSLIPHQPAIAADSPALPEVDEDPTSEGTVAASDAYASKAVSRVGIAPFRCPQLRKARELAILRGEDPATIQLSELQVNTSSHSEATDRLLRILRESSTRLKLEMLEQAKKEVNISAIEGELKKVIRV